jgi:ABC-2 type transport system permease protein
VLLYQICSYNPFTWAVELVRFSLYRQMNWDALLGVTLTLILFLGAALLGYDPARGLMTRKQGAR